MRRYILPLCVTVTGAMLAGCGGGGSSHSSKPHTTAAQRPVVTASPTTPPPSFTASHIGGSLLKAGDISSGVSSLPLTVPALKNSTVPSCSNSSVSLPGSFQISMHQFGTGSAYTGANYAELVAVYSDAPSALAAFSKIQAKATSCPSKTHVPSQKLPGNVVTIEHDNTWTLTQDTVSNWTHIRGFEKDVYPPSSSIINVIYFSYDYAVRGNVVLSSLYWQRVKPSASGTPIAQKATELLQKQLAKIG